MIANVLGYHFRSKHKIKINYRTVSLFSKSIRQQCLLTIGNAKSQRKTHLVEFWVSNLIYNIYRFIETLAK